MQFKPFKMYFIIILAIAIIMPGLSGCSQPTDSTADINDYDLSVASLTDMQGGNLHYQNLVLPVGNQIAFNSFEGHFCLAETDGSIGLELIESSASSPVNVGNQLFYTEGQTNGLLTRIDLDGTNHIRIGNTPLKYLLTYNQLLYAIDSETGAVISLKGDGTDRREITANQAVALALSNGKLFITGASADHGLTIVDLDSGEKTLLLTQRISSLNISGDWIYFAEPEESYRLTAWNMQSKSGQSISQRGLDNPFIVSNGYIYYIDSADQKRLYRSVMVGNQSIDAQKAELVVDDAVGEFVVCDNYVFYKRPSSSRIYRADVTGGQSLRIT